MRNFSFALLFSVLFLGSCTIQRNSIQTAGNSFTMAPIDERDGSSFEKGVPISETKKKEAVAAEDAWLSNKYPGHKVLQRILIYRNKHPFDQVIANTAEGKQVKVYFDASAFTKAGFAEKMLFE